MTLLPELAALLLVLLLALVAIRAGTRALERTGLPRGVAAFQAQSAFMGVGFTTTEAEDVVDHPVRRQVIRGLMWCGFGGVTALVGTIAALMVNRDEANLAATFGTGLLGIVALLLVWRLHPLERLVDWTIDAALGRVRSLEPRQLTGLLELGDHVVAQVGLPEGNWLVGRTLGDLRPTDEGVLVLTVTRSDGTRLLSPGPSTRLEAGDVLVCYGPEQVLEALPQRTADERGAAAHREARARQEAAEAREAALDAASTSRD